MDGHGLPELAYVTFFTMAYYDVHGFFIAMANTFPMAYHEHPWLLFYYGFPQVSMDPFFTMVAPWIGVERHGCAMDVRGTPWMLVVSCGFSWNAMDVVYAMVKKLLMQVLAIHDHPWLSMTIHGFPQAIHDHPRLSTGFHGSIFYHGCAVDWCGTPWMRRVDPKI
jgi:hypothetical protein